MAARLFLLAVVVIGTLLLAGNDAASSTRARCPPLQFGSVLAECSLHGRPADCRARPSEPGTVATFHCRPLHQFVSGDLPAAAQHARCGHDGQWSAPPLPCAPVCGRPTGKPTPFVRNGEVVSSSADYPWHAAIYMPDKPGAAEAKAGPKQVCGGSLVTPRYVVSAAHCFYAGKDQTPLPLEPYTIAFAKTNRSFNDVEANVQTRKIAAVHFNRYGTKKLQYTNDIALIRLSEAVEVTSWTQPVCVDWDLEQPELKDGDKGLVVGFGSYANQPTEVLRFAKLPFVSAEVCRKAVADYLVIFSYLRDKYCVGFVNDTTVGKGDSGGGMAFRSKDGSWFLRGIVSVGSPTETTYSFFTNVTHFTPWMWNTIRQFEGEPPSPIEFQVQCGLDQGNRTAYSTASFPANGSRVGHFPWSVHIVNFNVRDHIDEEAQQTAGVLVRPDLVITAGNSLVWPSEKGNWNDTGRIRIVNVDNLRVYWRDPNGMMKVSQVAAWHVHERDRGARDDIAWDVALLRLRTAFPTSSVACLDVHSPQPGVPQLADGDLGVVEISKWNILDSEETNSALHATTYSGIQECKKKWGGSNPADTFTSDRFCIEFQDSSIREGTPFLVRSGDSWFLRGIMTFAWSAGANSHALPYSLADLDDASIRDWLRDNMKKKRRTVDFQAPLTTNPAEDVELNFFPAQGECGQSNITVESLPKIGPAQLNVPWSVGVLGVPSDIGNFLGGVLVDRRFVLTAGNYLVTPPGKGVWNVSGEVRVVEPSTLRVAWVDPDVKNWRRFEVAAVHVHKREQSYRNDYAWDVGLLELRTPVPTSSVACLDVLSAQPTLVPLEAKQLGMMDETNDILGEAHQQLQRGTYVPIDECRRNRTGPGAWGIPSRAELFTPDRFCATYSGPVLVGTPFMTRVADSWYVRGVMSFTFDATVDYGPSVLADLAHPALRAWLRDKMQVPEEQPPQEPLEKPTTEAGYSDKIIFEEEENAQSSTVTQQQLSRPPTTQRPPTQPPSQQMDLHQLNKEEEKWVSDCGKASAILEGLVNATSDLGAVDDSVFPWSVLVRASPSAPPASGSLVRPDLVVTAGINLVTPSGKGHWNHSGEVRAIDVRQIRVSWFDPTDSWRRQEVVAVHVRERDRGDRSDYAWDVALLQLRRPFATSSVACLDVLRPQPTLTRLRAGDLGIMQTWLMDEYNKKEWLVETVVYKDSETCRKLDHCHYSIYTTDRNCAYEEQDQVKEGSGFLVFEGDRWYLRGLKTFTCDLPETEKEKMRFGPSMLVNLDDAAVREWLRKKIWGAVSVQIIKNAD